MITSTKGIDGLGAGSAQRSNGKGQAAGESPKSFQEYMECDFTFDCNNMAANKAAVQELLNSDLTPQEKYEVMREKVPAGFWGPDGQSLLWVDVAMGWSSGTAVRLSRAIDPYGVGGSSYMNADGSRASSVAPGDAEQIGWDASGAYHNMDTASDMDPGELRDISNEWANQIIHGNAPMVDASGQAMAGGAQSGWNRQWENAQSGRIVDGKGEGAHQNPLESFLQLARLGLWRDKRTG